MDSDLLHNILSQYAIYLQKEVKLKNLSANTIPKKFRSIKKILNVNGREYDIRWKQIESLFPKSVKRTGFKPYTDQHIKKMLQFAGTPRNIAVIHFMASTGARLGVHDHSLKMKHLLKMSSITDPNFLDCYAVLLYADDDITIEEKDIRDSNKDSMTVDDVDYFYYGFLTPEATKCLDEYFEYRTACGEKLLDESPIFRSESKFKKSDEQLNGIGFRNMLFKLITRRARIFRKKTGNRFDIQISHGFRKRFNTVLKIDDDTNSNANPNIVEKLMAHKRGLDGVYLMPTRQQCFREFVKGIPALTLDKSENLLYKKCRDCYALNEPKSQNCSKCNNPLVFDSVLKDHNKLKQENHELKGLLDKYSYKLEESDKQNAEFMDLVKKLYKKLED